MADVTFPIRLNKPLGTDIYDISVFNSNFSKIENGLNHLNSSKYSVRINTDSTADLNISFEGIILNPEGFSTGITSETGECSFVISTGNFQLLPQSKDYYQIMFTKEGKMYQRHYHPYGNIATDWIEVNEKTEVIDNLTSTDTDKALSANQGKVLDEKILDGLNSKLKIRYVTTTITLLPKTSGIYVCDGATVTSGDVPEGMEISLTDPTNNHFIIEVYGNLSKNSVLIYLTDINTGKRAIRRRLLGATSWSDWEILN